MNRRVPGALLLAGAVFASTCASAPARAEDAHAAASGPAERASRQAHEATTLALGGFIVQVAGVGGIAAGVGLSAQPDASYHPPGNAFAIGGIIVLLAGTLIEASAAPHLYSALTLQEPPVRIARIDLPPTFKTKQRGADTRAELRTGAPCVAPEQER